MCKLLGGGLYCFAMRSVVRNGNGELGTLLPPDDVLFGRSSAMVPVRRRIEKICATDVPVLFCGEPGSGKELLARWLHLRSPYSGGRFVKVNCAAIPGTLLESDLFGYEKGAFTGARATKPGRVELAHKGTLFLDQIANLDTSLQSKLLHFVQDGSFSRIGGQTELSVDTRIMCATTKDLQEEIGAGRFRADLFYRISVIQVRLPGLRERREDVPLLAEYFHGLHRKQFDKECQPLSSKLLNYLENLDWPGNARELSNCIARYVLIGQDAFSGEDFSPQKRRSFLKGSAASSGNIALKGIAKEAIREMERNVIMDALRMNQWNRRKTAEALKISYRALIYKIRGAGLGSRRMDIPEAASGPSPAQTSVAS
jgi:two-component system, NtrC family, response regulator AtoC